MSSAASTDAGGFRPWHFFVLAGLIAATAAVLLSKQPTPANLIFLSAAIGAAALAALALHHTLAPLVSRDRAAELEPAGSRSRAALEREKTLVLRSIKELEFDRAMGKVSEQDFHDMAGRLRARAIGLMKQLDQDSSGYRELIERELEVRLKQVPLRSRQTAEEDTGAAAENEPVAPTCGSCGTPNDADARFCKSCGSRVDQ